MLLTGRTLSSAEALAAGAFSEVTATDDGLLARVQELAAELAENAPITVRAAKSTILSLRQAIPEDNFEPALEAYMSEDFKEGVEAFRAKRKPRWRGV
jgi:enoyl-CoA hydratase/carnithine racemase